MTVLAGRYHLGDEIARGGMAAVFHAVDNVLKRPVAVKILALERSRHYAYRDAVRREALSGAQLTHPNVARVFDYGEQKRAGRYLPFVVMEFVPGNTLATRLTEEGPMPWREAAAVCADVAAGLAAAHARDLVHRDVKPANIVVSPGGSKLVDFGVSARTGERQYDANGTLWGTAAYFAPEQLRGAPAGPAADIYALGLVLHACLTGQSAWTGSSASEVLAARALTPNPRLPESCDLPDAMSSIYRRCLAPRPRKRPSAPQVTDLLRDASREGGRSRYQPSS